MGDRVKLYLAILADEETPAHVAEFEAEEKPKTYAFVLRELARHPDGYEMQLALNHSISLLKAEREDRLIGLDAFEAAQLAVAFWRKRAEAMEKNRREAERNAADCEVLK
jgi:hypothetical protein